MSGEYTGCGRISHLSCNKISLTTAEALSCKRITLCLLLAILLWSFSLYWFFMQLVHLMFVYILTKTVSLGFRNLWCNIFCRSQQIKIPHLWPWMFLAVMLMVLLGLPIWLFRSRLSKIGKSASLKNFIVHIVSLLFCIHFISVFFTNNLLLLVAPISCLTIICSCYYVWCGCVAYIKWSLDNCYIIVSTLDWKVQLCLKCYILFLLYRPLWSLSDAGRWRWYLRDGNITSANVENMILLLVQGRSQLCIVSKV